MRASDSLWPVLLLSTFVLSSGGALEVYARSREVGAVHIAVALETAPPSTNADTNEDAADDAPDSAAPISEAHAQARILARRGELEQAITLLAQLSAERPDALGPKLDLGYWLRQKGKLTESLTVLAQAQSLAPTSVSAIYQLASSQFASGNGKDAELGLRRALELKANHGPSLLALSRVLKKRGAFGEALELLQRAVRFGSNSERAAASLALGKMRLSMGKPELAVRDFKTAVEFAPADPSLRLSIAKAYLATGNKQLFPAALEQAERAAALAPDRALVIGLLGWVRDRCGDREGARSAFQQSLQLDPNQDYAERKLLRLDLAAQDLRSARRHAEHLATRLPEDPEHHFLLALVTGREGRVDDARTYYMTAIEKAKGNYPEAFFNLGRLEKSAGKLDASVANYKKALELKPDYPEALNNLGLVLLAQGKASDATAAWKQALELDAHYASAWVNLGDLAASERDFDQAEASFEKALGLKPQLTSALLGLARARRDLAHLSDAVATYRDLLAVQPRHARGWFELSELLERRGELRDAADAAGKATALAPDEADYLLKHADLLAKLGELKAAQVAFEELLDRSPGHQEARLGLAELLLKLGDELGCEREARRVDSGTGLTRARALVARCSKT